MAGNPCIVAADVTFMWDGGEQRLQRGTIIDVPAASALEEAIGQEHLVPLRPVAALPAPAAEKAPAAPVAAKETAPPSAARPARSAPQDAAEAKAGKGGAS
jgi:hypothetical protein